jgi:hypothetical protein
MKEGQAKYWQNGFQVRGGYFWTLAFRLGKYGVMIYYPLCVSFYRLT